MFWHKYRAKAVECLGDSLRYTKILYVCQTCGKSKVVNIEGHWNLEDLKIK